MGAMAVKGYTILKVPVLLEPHHQIVLRHVQDIYRGSLTSLLRSSLCILQPQRQGHRFLTRLVCSLSF